MHISTATQSELDILLIDPGVHVVPSADLNTLPIGTIIRLQTLGHWKYLLQIDEKDGVRVVHVVLSDKTGDVGSAKYRGSYRIQPDYAILSNKTRFKYGNLLTAILGEVALLP